MGEAHASGEGRAQRKQGEKGESGVQAGWGLGGLPGQRCGPYRPASTGHCPRSAHPSRHGRHSAKGTQCFQEPEMFVFFL